MSTGQASADKQWPAECASTLNAHYGDKWGLEDQHALGGAALFVPSLNCNHEAPTVVDARQDPITADNVSLPLGMKDTGHAFVYPINTQIATRCEALGEGTGLGIGNDGSPSFTLQAAHSHAVAYSMITANTGANGLGVSEEIAPTLDRAQPCAVAFAQNTRDELREMEVVGALAAQPGMKQQSFIRQHMQVRRLLPVECEKLQGFPKNYTNVPHNGKPAADGPRYKALGNSMARNVMEWIGTRIEIISQGAA